MTEPEMKSAEEWQDQWNESENTDLEIIRAIQQDALASRIPEGMVLCRKVLVGGGLSQEVEHYEYIPVIAAGETK